MALRATKMMSAKHARAYFKNALVRQDYYQSDREIAGVWGGSLAKRLGLEGEVDAERYFRLIDNQHPETGEKLRPRTDQTRRIGFDLTFSAPKSVSIQQGLMDSTELHGAFESAVAETLDAMEKDMQVRISGAAKFAARDTGNALWAGFTHWTSRPVDGMGADCHLHKHCVVFNVTFDDQEDRFKAGEFNKIVTRRAFWEAVFHNNLARKVQELGYRTRRDLTACFELDGYGRETIEKFSRRTQLIEATARKQGIVDPAKKAELGAKTRKGKAEGLSIADHRESWWQRLTPEERATVQAIEAARGEGEEGRSRGDGLPRAAALEHAVRGCFERQSVVKRHDFLAAMLKAGVGAFTLEEAEAELDQAAQDGRILQAEWDGETCITTDEVLKEEERMIATIRDSQGQCRPLVREHDILPPTRDGRERPDDWAAAARAILASRDRMTMMVGKTGAGKTSVMQTVADALDAEGTEIIAVAPSTKASRVNQVKAGFEGAETLAMLFASPALQEKLRGQVLWVDEAGMMGAKDTLKVFELAEQLDARVILTGDPNQHKPIARGDAMRILEDFAGVEPVRLSIIRRQTEAQYREAAEALNEGRIEEGFDRLEEMGAIHEIEDPEDRYRQLAKDYVHFTRDKGKSVVVVAPTHYERRLVNEFIREELIARGVIDAAHERTFTQWESRSLQESEKADVLTYAAGDKLRFHRAAPGFQSGSSWTVTAVRDGDVFVAGENGVEKTLPLDLAERFEVFEEREIALAPGDELLITKNGQALSLTPGGKPQRLANGQTFEVAGFTKDGNLRLQNGLVVDSNYATLDYSYGVTSHRSQSLGEDVVLVAESEASFAAAGREQWLVSVTRGKEAVRIYTDDREGLREAVQRSAVRLSATELLQSAERARIPEAEHEELARLRDWSLTLSRRAEVENLEVEGVDLGRRSAEPEEARRDELREERGL